MVIEIADSVASKECNTSKTEVMGIRKRKTSFFQMFRYSDALDKFLMIFGVLVALAQGSGLPLGLYFFYSRILNAMIIYSECFANVRGLMTDIANAQRNGTLASLPTETLAFMNTTDYLQADRYHLNLGEEKHSVFAEVWPNCLYYALIGVGMYLGGCLHVACWTIAGERQIERIRNKLFRSILSKDAGWFDERRAGALNNTIFESIRKMEEGMTSKISLTFCWFGVAITGIVIAFVTDWLVTIVICSLVPILFIGGSLMVRFVRSYNAKQSQAYGIAGAIANEVISNSRTVMAFNKQEYEVQRYGRYLGESIRMALIKTISSGAAQGLDFFTVSCIGGLAFRWGNNPQVQQAGGNIMQIIVCVMVATTSLANASPNIESIAAALSGADEVYSIIDETSRIDNFSDEGGRLDRINGGIAFENVAFAYPSRPERIILRSLNLEIAPGQTVALVGPSGCGKSTTVQMLLRFYEALSGKVSIDGVDVREMNIRWLRQHIGLVSQEPVLFNTSIKENICLGSLDRESVSDEDLIAACKLANAHSFISALPDGYNTMVGERGAQLSGGQKQRIAIARALISNPKILFLDEATSALDTASEKVVQQALDNARVGRTTLVIAHRLSTIRNADRIAVIDGGVVAELGDHASLMKIGGLYSRLVKTQEVEQEKEAMRKNKQRKEAQVETIDEVENEDASKMASSTKNFMQMKLKEQPGDFDLESGDKTSLKKVKRPSRVKVFATVLSWGRPELHLTLLCILVSALAGAVHPAFAIVQSEFLGAFCPGDTQDKFKMLIGITIGLGAFQAIMLTLQYMLFSMIGERLTERIRHRLLGKVLRMDAAWLDRQENQPSILTTILATDCIDIQGLSGVRVSLISNIVVVVGIAIIYALILEYRIALALMGLTPLIVMSNIISSKTMMGSEDSEESKGQAIIAMDPISNMRTVMALTAEPYFCKRFAQQFATVKKNAIRGGIAFGPLVSFIVPSILFSAAITFSLGSWLLEKEGVPFKDILRVFILVTFTGMAIGLSSTAVPDQDKAHKAATKLMSIFGEKPQIDKENEKFESIAAKELTEKKSLLARAGGAGRIDFKDVVFSYPTRPGIQVLKGVSFSVEPGQRVALCGPSGGGKSTIMQLVQRLYDPDSGSVEIDGVDIRQANIRAVRSNIGLVAQEPILFAMSVGENISYGSKIPEDLPNDEEVGAACKQANVLEFLSRLPVGLKTQVGERGGQLSGGQKQRISIARALVRNPTILLLDEATSALDTESEQIVQAALDAAAQGRTTLTIAHRLSTIQNSDKILVLANGRVAEEGTHPELMALHGIYYDLQQTQNKK